MRMQMCVLGPYNTAVLLALMLSKKLINHLLYFPCLQGYCTFRCQPERRVTPQLLPYLCSDTITLVNVHAPRQRLKNPQTAVLTAEKWFDPCCTHTA